MKLWSRKIGFEAFEEKYLNKNYDAENLYIWYIQQEEKVIATMMLNKLDKEIGRIENVCCDIEYRGKGLAKRILDEIFEFAREINLQKLQLGTYESLERAIGFYKKYGFIEKEEERNPITKARYYEMILN